jgi:exopolysaccharide production protein ExoZ
MGDASYGIYLTHSFLLGAFALATGRVAAAGNAPLALVVLLGCLLCFGAGWLTWRFVERPLTERLRGKRPAPPELVAP